MKTPLPIHPNDTTDTLPAARGGNDNGAPVAASDTTRLLAAPDVVRVITRTLRRFGVKRQDMRDAIADVQADAVEAARRGPMPACEDDWKALATTIATRRQIDRLRKQEVAARYDDGLTVDDADAYEGPRLHGEGRDPVDTKRYIAVLKELFDEGRMPDRGDDILWAVAEGVDVKDIAAEVGISERAVHGRVARMRDRFALRLAELGILSLALLVGLLCVPAVLAVAREDGSTGGPRVAAHMALQIDAEARVRIGACPISTR